MITYTVKVVETEGLCWRESVLAEPEAGRPPGRGDRLDDAGRRDDQGNGRRSRTTCSGKLIQAPKVTTASGAPATIHCRRNEAVVTQAVWMGDELAGKALPKWCAPAGTRP